MSSIYKKGRDGYFYYQTYVFNEKTGKKNKRIFHALGTKDSKVAKEKQVVLDTKYRTIIDASFKKSNENNKHKIRYLSLFGIIISIILGFVKFYPSSKVIQPKNGKDSLGLIGSSANEIKKNSIEKDIVLNEQALNPNTETSNEQALNPNTETSAKKLINPNEAKKIKTMPRYTLRREIQMPGPFNQGKIFITVDKNTEVSNIKFLCDQLLSQFKKYSNLIICVYSNDDIGIRLANGYENLNKNDLGDVWLALYTYNAIEGSFFDDNPTIYQNIF